MQLRLWYASRSRARSRDGLSPAQTLELKRCLLNSHEERFTAKENKEDGHLLDFQDGKNTFGLPAPAGVAPSSSDRRRRSSEELARQ